MILDRVRNNGFKPLTITLETVKEVRQMRDLLYSGQVGDHPSDTERMRSLIYNHMLTAYGISQ